MNLADLLKLPVRKVYTERLSRAVAKSKYVNPEATKSLGIVKCLDKELFPPDSKPVAIRREVSKQRDFTAWIIAFLSKNPHYKYIQTTLSGWSPGRKYWFLDTSRQINVVISYDDITKCTEFNPAKDFKPEEIVEKKKIEVEFTEDDELWYMATNFRCAVVNLWNNWIWYDEYIDKDNELFKERVRYEKQTGYV